MKQACSFSLITAQTEYRFFSSTSTSYQKWVGALTQAFENMSTNNAVQEVYRPTSPAASSAPSGLARPLSVMSRDPEDYVETHRVISVNRNTSRRSISQNRRKSYTQDALVNLNQAQAKSESVSLVGDFGRKKSIFQKVKSFFGSDVESGIDARADPNDGFEGDGGSRPRSRSKSVVKYLFGNTEEVNQDR